MDGKACWFKRQPDDKEWERGEAYTFYNASLPGGINLTSAVISAKHDGQTLAIPLNLVYLTDENPDKIREKLEHEEAKKAEKERLERHAEDEKHAAAARLEVAKAEKEHAEAEKKAHAQAHPHAAAHTTK